MTALSKFFKTTIFRWSLAYILIFVVGSGVVIGFLFWRTNDLITSQVMQTIAAEVKGLREQFQTGGGPLLARTVDERGRTKGSGIYFLSDRAGAKIAGNLNRLPPELANGQSGGLFTYQRVGEPDGPGRLAVGVPIEVAGGALLIVGRDIEDQRDFIEVTRRILLWGVGFVVLFGLGVGFLISRSILKRIDAVTDTSRTIMRGDLSGRIALNGSGDELDRLSESLNAMLERIEQLMTGMKEVSDNIAHDLKTPLTRLRNRTEAALRDHRGEVVYREALEKSLEEADELIRTFNALLSIARLEAGAVGGSRVSMNLKDVVRDVAELYEPVAEERDLDLELDLADGVRIDGERQLIGQAVANLIDNAIKYAGNPPASGSEAHRSGGRVRITLSAIGDQAEIAVADNGPGIPEAQRARVLKRFVRLEESRSQPGSGLGLSLVAAVAQLHGGCVRLEDNAPGLRVVIALPGPKLQKAVSEHQNARVGKSEADDDGCSGQDGLDLWKLAKR